MKTIQFAPNKESQIPLYVQLYTFFKMAIVSGKISDNERLPSCRKLVKDLNLSRATVDNAYHLLERDGFAYSRPRSGFFARCSSPITSAIAEEDFYSNPGISINMSHQGIDLPSIPTTLLSRLFRNFTYDMPSLFSFGHKYGEEELRKAISKSLFELHSIDISADRIIIGAGSEYLLEQLVHIFDKSTVFGFENPPFARSYIPIKNAAQKVEFLNSSPDYFHEKEIYESNINVLYISPESSFPFNRRLSPKQQQFLLNWVHSAPNRYIIEAAFDLDFAENPYPTLISQDDSDNVIFLSSFSRSIAPSIKIAYMILPEFLKTVFNNTLPYYTCLASRIEQQVIADYISTHKYRGHVSHLTEIYNKKRNLLLSKLKTSPLADVITLSNTQSGTYFIITVNKPEEESSLKIAAAENGVKLNPISACLILPSNFIPKNSFIMGFGELTVAQIKDAVCRLEKAWHS